jgi:hypothetical protein
MLRFRGQERHEHASLLHARWRLTQLDPSVSKNSFDCRHHVVAPRRTPEPTQIEAGPLSKDASASSSLFHAANGSA